METLHTGCFVFAGVIKTAPLIGFFSDGALTKLYGLSSSFLEKHSDVRLMLRHRAALFGCVGGLLLWAAPRRNRQFRTAAAVTGMFSMASYLFLYASLLPPSWEMKKVALFDVAALASMLVAVGSGALGTKGSDKGE